MLWKCPIKVSIILDQCALSRGVTWRDPARHVTCLRLAGSFMSVVERGVRVEWVPNSFANFNRPFLCLALMVPCCLCLFYGAVLWWPFTWSVIFTYSVFSFVWCDVIKSTVFYSLFCLVSERVVLHCLLLSKEWFWLLSMLFLWALKDDFCPWF